MDLLDIDLPALQIVINIVLAALLSFASAQVYIRCGTALSNRREFAGNFYILSMVTALVISIVKSSLALSLGLVGALSIVRFRTAIKEPEELAFLFVSIAIGLGIGAEQQVVTAAAVTVIFAIVVGRTIVSRRFSSDKQLAYNLKVVIPNSDDDSVSVEKLTDLIGEHCTKCGLKRVQSTSETLDASFRIEFGGVDALGKISRAITSLNPAAELLFLDVDNVSY